MAFEKTWRRIETLAGETFYELGGSTFTYEIREGKLRSSTADAPIDRSDFERVFEQGECPPPRQLKQLGFDSRAASCIFSILTDPRLKDG